MRGLERDVEIRDNKIKYLTNELEQVKKEKESLDIKLTGFKKASKDLDNLLGSQRSDKNKESLGYNAVPPSSPAQVYSPHKKYLSWIGLPEFVDDTVTDYSRPTPSIDASKCNTSDLQSSNFSVSGHGESSGSIMSKPRIKFIKAVDCPRVIKTNNTENARKLTVKYAEMYGNISKSPKVRVNQRNWNNLKSQQLGKYFLMQNKACFKCSYFDHLASNYGVWVEQRKTWPKGKSAVRTQPRVPRVSNVTKKFPTVESKFSTTKSTFTADLGNKRKAVKASACWIWRPKQNTTEKGPNCNGVSVTFKKYQYINTQGRLNGCSRHMTRNLSYLSEYEPYDGGYVSFGHGGGKITEMNEFCTKKWIRREFSNARTPQQNRVAERRNRTLIEAARTMLADAKLPVTFWAEAINTAYHLGKFDAKGDEGYFVGYSLSSKAFRVFNKRTKKVEENLHVDFLENKLIEKGAGPNWLFDIDTLTNSMSYVLVVFAGTSSTNISGTKDVTSQDVKKDVSSLRYIALPNWFHEAHMETRNSDAPDGCNADVPESDPTATSKVLSADQVELAVSLTVESEILTVSSPVPTVCLDISPESSSGPRLITKEDFSQKETLSLGNDLTLSNGFEDTFRVEADLSNMETSIPVSPTLTFRIHKDHPKSQIIGQGDGRTKFHCYNSSKDKS
nr:hypothetical protein [Tanacetum cinerariifolium]